MLNDKKINNFPSSWYGNNCLIRYEFPVGEGESSVPNTSDMLSELCKHRKLPDMEFFINRRDFPILTKDHTEPYDNILSEKFKVKKSIDLMNNSVPNMGSIGSNQPSGMARRY